MKVYRPKRQPLLFNNSTSCRNTLAKINKHEAAQFQHNQNEFFLEISLEPPPPLKKTATKTKEKFFLQNFISGVHTCRNGPVESGETGQG